MTIKVYDRDFGYSTDDVQAAQDQLNIIEPGSALDRMRTFGRFEFYLAAELTDGQQTTFSDWVSANYPSWQPVFI